ncbi:hypothetical protein BLJ79_21920 [Arthrobacter sp. UCD-GKA]|nr:hypothetical protein BLJ79_21920 [Arthrobacter sp. UCD-GKA]
MTVSSWAQIRFVLRLGFALGFGLCHGNDGAAELAQIWLLALDAVDDDAAILTWIGGAAAARFLLCRHDDFPPFSRCCG